MEVLKLAATQETGWLYKMNSYDIIHLAYRRKLATTIANIQHKIILIDIYMKYIVIRESKFRAGD